ncbi:conserved protein of unknown function [Tenacibaculum sp. 190130A14a]|uniref:Uncharacterized protein n=1 Tax=Tenacibaculum polynesiense TaxID=3137857 RepID=A0ABM9P7F9_9FLAO
MKNSYDQLNIEYVETKNVSSFIWYTTVILILVFIFIPLAELSDVIDYNYAAPHTSNYSCIVGADIYLYPFEPLQFTPLPIPN